MSEQIQTNTCHQDLLAYLSVRRQPIYITNSQHTWQQRLEDYRLPLFIGALKFQSHPTGQIPAINHNITASKCSSKQSENTRNGADVPHVQISTTKEKRKKYDRTTGQKTKIIQHIKITD